MEQKVALVVGASSGFGKDFALDLLGKGFVVYAAARNLAPMKDIESAGGRLLCMDVCSDSSVRDGVARILEEAQHLDVVLNNAGYGAYGPVEGVPLEEVMRQFDVNLFGMARVNNAVLPGMRVRKSGRILLTASMSSHISTPGSGWYAATKHAIKAMAEALRMEVAPLGIRVIQIEPGPVRTGFESVAFAAMDKLPLPDDYREVTRGFRSYMTRSYAGAPDTRSTVKAMVKAAISARPRRVYRSTFEARLLPRVRMLLGTALFETILCRILR